MTRSRWVAPQFVARWDVWWWWSIASLVGIAVGSLLLRSIDPILLPRDADEALPIAQPWRLAAANSALYLPVAVFQWWVIRWHVRYALLWVVIPGTSVGILYPGSIGLFDFFGFNNTAWIIYMLGFGGSAIYALAQALTPLVWIARSKRWMLWPITALLIGVVVLFANTSVANVLDSRFSASNPVAMLSTWGTYYLLMGILVAHIVQTEPSSIDGETRL